MKKIFIKTILLIPLFGEGQIREFLEREAHYQHFNGAVLVKNQHKIVYEGYHGLADHSSEIASNTSFDIGSISKQFTAAAILQLVAKGKIGLHERINKYLSKYSSEKWEDVTVHHLLTHTSGIPSLYQTEQGIPLVFPRENSINLEELVEVFRDGKVLHKPGTKFSYSNSGYVLLAAIVETVSGRDFADYLESEILQHFGLQNSSFGPNESSALPYFGYQNRLLRKAPVYDPSWMVGAGGIYSTVSDLDKWLTAIQSEDFLDEALKKVYLQPHMKIDGVSYGYGWKFKNDGWISHDGASAGATNFLTFQPETGQRIILLTNRGFENIHFYGKASERIQSQAKSLIDLQQGKEIDWLPKPDNWEVKEITFEIGAQKLQTDFSDTEVLIKMEGDNPLRLIPNTPLDNGSEDERKLLAIAQKLQERKHWGLARYCDGEMKFVCYSGLFAIGFNMIRKKVGELDEVIPYYVDEGHGLIRLKGSSRIIDLIVYFDDEGLVQGIFENGSYEKDRELIVRAYTTENEKLFLDGFPHGEMSAIIKIEGERVIYEQSGRKLFGRVIEKKVD